jgi:hypothetical protein
MDPWRQRGPVYARLTDFGLHRISHRHDNLFHEAYWFTYSATCALLDRRRATVPLPPSAVATHASVSGSSRLNASCVHCFGVRAGGHPSNRPDYRSRSTPTLSSAGQIGGLSRVVSAATGPPNKSVALPGAHLLDSRQRPIRPRRRKCAERSCPPRREFTST